MPRFKNNAHRFHCLFPGCLSSSKHDRDRTRHNGLHQIYYGHNNAFTCEVCCGQYPRSNTLNKHRIDTHEQEKMEKPYVVVEYCDSFKLVHSDEMRCIGKINVISITNFVGLTEDIYIYPLPL